MLEIKDKILNYRELKGINRAELGRRLNTSGQRIGQYEAGRQQPNSEFLKKWREVFGWDLLTETDVSHEPELKAAESSKKDLLLEAPVGLTVKDYINLQAEFIAYAKEMSANLKNILAGISSAIEGEDKQHTFRQNHTADNPGNEHTEPVQKTALDKKADELRRVGLAAQIRKKQAGKGQSG